MTRLKPISEYRLRSVFFRTLFALLVLMLLMMAAFFLFSRGVIFSSVSEINSNTNKNLLSKTSDIVDSYLKFLEGTIQHLTKDVNILSAVVAPNINRADRNFAIQNLLKTTAADNDLIQDVYLYIPYNDTIYSASRPVFQLKEFPDLSILDLCRSHTAVENVDVQNITTCFYNLSGTVYMARDFPLTGKKRMGSIILKLDSNVFYKVVQGDGTLNMPILIFDKDKNPVFSDARNYPFDSPMVRVKQALQSGQEYFSGSGLVFFQKTSATSGWTYLYEDKKDISALRVNNLLKTVFPILLILLLLSVSLSIYISNYIYKPIRDLMVSVLDSSISHDCVEKNKYNNEVEYLSSSFNQALLVNDELSTTLDGIVPVMENQLILDVLSGRNSSNDSVVDYLSRINSKLRGQGQFVMLAVLLIHNNSCSVQEVETTIYSISMNNIIQKVASDEIHVRVAVVENGIWAVLLKFDQILSQEAIKTHVSAFMHAIRSSIKQNNFYIQVGVGRIKDSFTEISQSYKEALRSINFAKYLDLSRGEDEDQATLDRTAAFDLNYAKTQIEKITADAAAGNAASALEKVKQIIDRITSSSRNQSELTLGFQAFMDTLYDMHLQYGVSDNDPIFVDVGEAIDFNSLQDPEDMTVRVEAACSQHVSTLCTFFSKRQNKLIYQAQKYIDENYSNGLLSQNDVADHLGINASYLSTIFNTVLQTRFTEYLNIRRVEKAKIHLAQTDLSIKQIVAQDGFNSVQNFMRVFKRFVGLSPGQYRIKFGPR
ncbi:MAG: helix-turn-helix domain-containing protein [Spirochaetia bacterium]|nr:helix-turn-helix domain-containing protein [Spirochaetia bacterium]